jgi:hypothetical protein
MFGGQMVSLPERRKGYSWDLCSLPLSLTMHPSVDMHTKMHIFTSTYADELKHTHAYKMHTCTCA